MTFSKALGSLEGCAFMFGTLDKLASFVPNFQALERVNESQDGAKVAFICIFLISFFEDREIELSANEPTHVMCPLYPERQAHGQMKKTGEASRPQIVSLHARFSF